VDDDQWDDGVYLSLAAEVDPDGVARWLAGAELGSGVCTPFGQVDPAGLSRRGRVDLLVALERQRAWFDAQQLRLLAAVAADPRFEPVEDVTHNWVREEVACALRVHVLTAQDRLHLARFVAEHLPATLEALERAEISLAHVRVLVEALRGVTDPEVLRLVEADVLPKAVQQTPGELRRWVRRSVARRNPRAEEQARTDAETRRSVRITTVEHGMAELFAYLPAEDAAAIAVALDSATATNTAGDCRTADQRRADTLVHLITRTSTDTDTDSSADPEADTDAGSATETPTGGEDTPGPGCPPRTWQGRRPSVHVTVALSTLLGLDDQPGELDRHGPIPASVARRIAADPSGTWRRLVTDEHGRLLDYGRSTYRPPADLREYVIARDQTCTFPGCLRSSRRCDLDHLTDWAHGGTTSADNLAPKCSRHHHCTHDTDWTDTRDEDGATTWTSPTGHDYTKPPDTLPIDTTSQAEDPDPPPF
jgi:hypothetical protein